MLYNNNIMNFIVVIILIAIAVYYASGQIGNVQEPLLLMYITWTTILISLNILVSVFIYLFSHSIKNSKP